MSKRRTVNTSTKCYDIAKPMDSTGVRLIPRVFDKLFFYTAPGDAVVGENVHCILGPIAARQLHYRITQPKNGMFMLAWPLCMHSSEDAKSFYREINFYDILRCNIAKNTPKKTVPVDVNEKMLGFMSGFETRMLHCVLNSTAIYSELNVLMLDFHTREAEICRSDFNDDCTMREASDEQAKWFLKEIPKPPPRNPAAAKSASTVNFKKPPAKKTAPAAKKTRAVNDNDLTRMRLWINDAKLWGRAISAVAAQCAPKLKHFVLIDSYWVPESLHYNLKLDSIFAQMQLVETIYLPHLQEYDQGHRRSRAKHPCWQALHDLPKEKRLPRLRRVVLDSPGDLIQQRPWSEVAAEIDAEMAAKHGISGVLSSMESFGKRPPAASRLPQIQLQSSLSKFIVEVFDNSYQKWFKSVKKHPVFEPAEKVEIVVRRLKNLKIHIGREQSSDCWRDVGSAEGLKTYYNEGFSCGKFRKSYDESSVKKFVNDIEKLVAYVTEQRQQNLSVLHCVKDEFSKSTTLVPVKYNCAWTSFTYGSAACVLKTLSTRLSWPVWLTMEMSWSSLFDYMPFFIRQGESIPPKWVTCFPRGQLKINLDNEQPLREDLSGQYGRYKERNLMAKVVPEHRYSFPSVTIQYTRHLPLTYCQEDNKPYIKKMFKEYMEPVIGDITGAIPPPPREDYDVEEEMNEEEKVAFRTQQVVDDAKHLETAKRITAATRNLRHDLYASAHKIVFHFAMAYMFPDTGVDEDVKTKAVRRLRALLQDKQLEYELMLEVFEKAFPKDEQQQQFLPNLKSVSITSEIDVDKYLALNFGGDDLNADDEGGDDEELE